MTTDTNITGVVFDLDGVIVDSEHLWEESWTAYCATRGVQWSHQHTTSVQGMSAPEWADYIGELVGDPDQADDIARFCVDYLIDAVAAGHGPLLPGAKELVVDVSARVPIALASSSSRPAIDAILTTHGIADRFSATVSSEEVARGKPSPDVYAEAAGRIGIRAGAGLAIEDSTNGIRAASAAGLHVVALPNAQYPPKPDALELADYTAADHADARNYILARLPEGAS